MDIFQEDTVPIMYFTGLVLVLSCVLLWNRFKRLFLGTYSAKDVFEIQVLHQGCEAEESLKEWQKCTKNPGHQGFIPISEFNIGHLPGDFRTPNWFLFIKSLANLTVRLRVKSVSPNRPSSGPFSLELGKEYHYGTGYIGGFTEEEGSCPCKGCERNHPSQASQKWWLLMITTAAHVVYDEHEVKATRVDLFYDDEAAFQEGRVKTLHGFQLKGASDHTDTCLFYCAVCDKDLAELIIENRADATELCRNLRGSTEENSIATNKPTKAVLISHPHARSKMITLGDIKTEARVVDANTKCKYYAWEMYECGYTAPSCPGSSGGHLLWFGDSRMGDNEHGWWFGIHCKGGKELVNHGSRLCIRRNKPMFWMRRRSHQGHQGR